MGATPDRCRGAAEIDLKRATVTEVHALGLKDHSLVGNGLDPSDRDNAFAIGNWPVLGMYMPNAMQAYEFKGRPAALTQTAGVAYAPRKMTPPVRTWWAWRRERSGSVAC